MPLCLNDLETRRFGVTCAQIDGQAAELPNLVEVNQAARAQRVAMISTRVDVGALDRVHALEADGYRLMDTLVYYGRSLRGLSKSRPLPAGITLRLATPEDAPAVERIARSAFRGYFGHYHADPRLDSAAADAAYVQWAGSSVARTDLTTPVLLAVTSNDIVGFVTLRLNTHDEGEAVLAAINPDCQGTGLYGHLFEQALWLCADCGAERMITSTQINNYATQRVWARLGLMHQRSVYTFHKWLTS
ncbi:GNAT family N-acetyltransferase [Microvirga arabica]|nr:GNAT family N-acetyltransferase [Microvirga arabica]MBM1172025.1 GNAT family N-acetyltransferase [Microvirga arabica]